MSRRDPYIIILQQNFGRAETYEQNPFDKSYVVDRHIDAEFGGSLYLACNKKKLFSLLNNLNDIMYSRVRDVVIHSIIFWITYLLCLFLNYIDKLLVVPWVRIVPNLLQIYLLCYERDFMLSLSDKNQANVNEAFNSTSSYLDDY